MSDGVQGLPTAYLLPIVARTENSALPLKGQLSDKIHHSSWPRKSHDRSISLDVSSRTRTLLRSCAAIVFIYGYMLQRIPLAGFCAVPSDKNHETAFRHHLTCLSALFTDRAMEAWYHCSIA